MESIDAATRTQILHYLSAELIGPRDGDQEKLGEPATIRYLAGTLYPRQASMEGIAGDEEEEQVGTTGPATELTEDQGDDPITLANQYLPGSFGISFFLKNSPKILISVEAGRYEKKESAAEDLIDTVSPSANRRVMWERIPLAEQFELSPPSGRNSLRIGIFDDLASIYAVWRPTLDGWLVTVSLLNNKVSNSAYPKPEDCLHQVRLRCEAQEPGRITSYPRVQPVTEDVEEQVLDLLYRHAVIFGAGHGCSVAWSEVIDGSTDAIWSEFLPSHTVPPLTFELRDGDQQVLSMQFLADEKSAPRKMLGKLEAFVSGYEAWIASLPQDNQDIPGELAGARDKLLARLRQAASRMRRGVATLRQNSEIRRAFQLANRAMLLQRIHSGPAYAGTKRPRDSEQYVEPDLDGNEAYRDIAWRPFQLAFQLLSISSVAFPDDPDRDTVDLIWFPTGGGKTEAYLAVAAFLIFVRRIQHGKAGPGTAVLMRYTLRLLTTQQFQRAATLIAACEVLRRQRPDELGHEEISIGLWLGQSTTPNNYGQALQAYQRLMQEDRPLSPFQIDRCPWCGTEMVPERQTDEPADYGFLATENSFLIYCPSQECPFYQSLPVQVVDDALYETPPTFLLATVDKFARTPWEARVSAFFGSEAIRPPELIIQDELHLISGPLGTIVGIYEVALERLCTRHGIRPKILASTATIRRADEQCRGLYARDVQLFPPSGLDARDSYFSREDRDSPGRLYVGFMGQGHTGSTTMVRVCAGLLQAPIELELVGDDLDAYWTLVAYHNSLRELGKTLTFANDDIPARIQVIGRDDNRLRALNADNIAELTSNVEASSLTDILDRLNRKAWEDRNISFLACTNMLSVGIDVSRLGLMLVNGQPKSTSEYIQATSRVGRGKVPGLVICLYSSTKPRDRSHYERFIGYHSALYRQVEPTSVTPFSAPARHRALPAVLVSLVRHLSELKDNKSAGRFRQSLDELEEISDYILTRIESVDPKELEASRKHLSSLIEEWNTLAESETVLYYESTRRQVPSLMKPAGASGHSGRWETLNSMRNVDRSCLISIMDKEK